MSQGHFPVTHTEAEWRALLTPEQYAIMREHGTERAGSCALNSREATGRVLLRRLRPAPVREQDEVRQRHRLAELQHAGRRSGRDVGRPELGHDPHRGALRPMRLASRPRVSRRPSADRPALLHQRRGDQLYAGGRMKRLRASGDRRGSGDRCRRRTSNSRVRRMKSTGTASPDSRPRRGHGRPANHPPVRSGRIGVLIVNLGTPEGTDYWSMRRYLKEFLSDKRVIEAPRAVWAPILAAHPAAASLGPGTRLCVDLEQRARRGAAEDDHPVAKREARRGARRSGARGSRSTGRCATASRRSPSV